jgi:hypothetical protein
MSARYAFYAHLEAPVYEFLEGVSRQSKQSKSFIVSEALKHLDARTIPPKHKKAVEPGTKRSSKWSIQEPISFFTSR